MITHTLFVHDIFLFGLGIVEEWQSFKGILHYFYVASGMEVSLDKSPYFNINLDENRVNLIQGIFPLRFASLNDDFKYLGFSLRPRNY